MALVVLFRLPTAEHCEQWHADFRKVVKTVHCKHWWRQPSWALLTVIRIGLGGMDLKVTRHNCSQHLTHSNTVNNKQQHCQQQTATLSTTNSNTVNNKQQYCQQQTATLLTTNSNTVNNKQQHCQQQTATLLTTNSNTHCQHQTTSYSVTSNNKHVTLSLATTNTLLCHWQHKHVTLSLATTNMLL